MKIINTMFLLKNVVVIILSVMLCHADDDYSDKGCNNPADVVFVLDESGSIWGPHFTDQLNFVQDIVESFDVRPNKTRFGAMTFATEPRVIFHLGDYHTHKELKDNIRVIEQKRGETYSDKALNLLRTEMFVKARSWVPRVAIFITDGESNYPEDTAKAAKLAHQAGIQIFAVGVGPYVNKDELLTIAGSPDSVFQVDSYAVLETLRDMLAWKTCQVTTLPPLTTTPPPPPQMIQGCSEQTKMDLMWALPDMSSSVENDQLIDFVTDVTSEMELSPLKVQVGMTPRFCPDYDPIDLKDHDTQKGFISAVQERRRDSNANTHQHLKYLRETGMTGGSGARDDAVKTGVLVVDSTHGSDLVKATREAKRAKEAGIRLIVVGVGGDVEEDELTQLASVDDVIIVEDYDDLADAKSSLIARICAGMSSSIKMKRFLIKRFYNIYEN